MARAVVVPAAGRQSREAGQRPALLGTLWVMHNMNVHMMH